MRFDRETHTVHAGGRSWRADPACTRIENHFYGDRVDWTGSPDYASFTRRCRVMFESGWEASIIWGSGTYSDNHDVWSRLDKIVEEPTTVEVGVCDRTGELRMRRYGDEGEHNVEAYLDDDALVRLLDELAVLPTDYDYGDMPPTAEDVKRMGDELRQMYGKLKHDE